MANYEFINQGPAVQSIVSLTSSLRGQLVKIFTTLLPDTLKFFVEKMREAFALQKLLTIFQQKYWQNLDINIRKFKDGLPYLFHSFRNKYFNKSSLGNMLYFQNKL